MSQGDFDATDAAQHSDSLSQPAVGDGPFDISKFENVHQVGGIRTAILDGAPVAGAGVSGAQGCRVAMVNTGTGLRFTVALDRGGDIVEACYNQHSLAYLTPNGYRPPNPAYHQGLAWLDGWPGGLLTSCGPVYAGPPREEDDCQLGLHGHHSNTPAAVEMLINPDPHRGRYEMLLSMVMVDSRMFGPVVEVRRQIQCTLGQPQITLYDQVTNRGNATCAHNWIYHVNLGYPLLNQGAHFVYRGKAGVVGLPRSDQPGADVLNGYKTAPANLPEHAGTGERVIVTDAESDDQGLCHVGLINRDLSMAFEMIYESQAMPRLLNWQHFGPGGSYVTGIEPLSGSLLGKAVDKHHAAEQWLEPGQTKRYQLTMKVHTDPQAIDQFAAHDGPLTT